MNEKKQKALGWIRENPGAFLGLTLKRLVIFWCPPPDMWREDSSARLLKFLAFSLVGVGTFLGLLHQFLVRNPKAALLAAAAIGPSLVYLITHVNPRYRYPVFGLSVLLTCQFLLDLARPAFQLVLGSVRQRAPVSDASPKYLG